MASVSFKNLVLNLASDETQPPLILRMQTMQPAPAMTLGSQAYADGQFRIGQMTDYQYVVPVHLVRVPAASRQMLELPPSLGGWLGLTVCVRGLRSRKFFGYWDPPSIDEAYRFDDYCHVDLTLKSAYWSDLQ